MTEVEKEIRKMIAEMKSGHNDGWTIDHYRKQLINIRDIIEGSLK